MSETKTEEEVVDVAPKKKGKKLPMIIAFVAILGGGGFFMMKGKGKEAKKPAVELGLIEPMPKEFLVNLGTSPTYLRAAVSLHLAKDFKKEAFDKNLGAVEDAIGGLLSSKSPVSIRTLDGKRKLKREVAQAINAILAESDGHKEPEKDKKKDAPGKPPADWDSAEGPCLKIYFTSFATQ